MNLIDGFVFSDGGKNAVFQEKFIFTLIEGLRDLKVAVWNSNTLSTDDFIGNATYVSLLIIALLCFLIPALDLELSLLLFGCY